MEEPPDYYYEDAKFHLEWNLQNIRRDLVDLLDDYKFHDCSFCNRLKCSCSKTCFLRSTTASMPGVFPYVSGRASNDKYFIVAPPADTLPIPRWHENITSNRRAKAASEKVSPISLKNWIRASIHNITQSTSSVSFPVPRKVLDHVDYSWPPLPESIWSKERLKATIARERLLSYNPHRDGNSPVEVFFNYFSGNRANTKTKLAR